MKNRTLVPFGREFVVLTLLNKFVGKESDANGFG